MSSPKPAESLSPSQWSRMRETCTAIRELLIVAAMLILLISPASVRTLLERAGIRSVAGVEFVAEEIGKAEIELAAAQRQIAKLEGLLAIHQSRVSSLVARANEGQSIESDALRVSSADMRETLDQAYRSLGNVGGKLQRLRQNAERQGIEIPTGEIPQATLTPPDELISR